LHIDRRLIYRNLGPTVASGTFLRPTENRKLGHRVPFCGRKNGAELKYFAASISLGNCNAHRRHDCSLCPSQYLHSVRLWCVISLYCIVENSPPLYFKTRILDRQHARLVLSIQSLHSGPLSAPCGHPRVHVCTVRTSDQWKCADIR
jgi:hypothetical protein